MKKKPTSLNKLAFPLAASMAMGLSLTGKAQDANAPTEPEKLEKVVVTGSNIPEPAGAIPASPVEVFATQQIRSTGSSDVLDVLKRLSSSFAGNGNVGQTVNNGGFGEANVAIRNLPTLVLLNGRRLANSALSGGAAVDVNTLPLAMIDRIEVLKDGASTIYGSDAIGGVVNIITKKNFSGAEISGGYGAATREGNYTEYKASIIAGTSTEKTSVTLGGSLFRNDPLMTKDRHDPAALDVNELQARGSANPPSYYSGSYMGRVGNYVLAGSPLVANSPNAGTYYNPAMSVPPSPQNPNVGGVAYVPGAYSSINDYRAAMPGVYVPITSLGYSVPGAAIFDTTQYGTYSVQKQDHRNFFGNFEHQIFDNEKLTVFGSFLYADNTSEATLAPTPLASLGLYNIAVPANNPYNPFGVALPDTISNARSRFLDLSKRSFETDTHYYNFAVGLKSKINDRYSWEGAYNYNQSDQVQYTHGAVDGAALNQTLIPLLDSTGAQVKNVAGLPLSVATDGAGNNVPVYNLFAGAAGHQDPATLALISGTAFESGVSELWSFDWHLNGNPFDLKGGPVQFAAGLDYVYESLSLNYDVNTVKGLWPGLNQGTPFPGGSRDRWAGYVEARIPIFSPEWNIPVFHSLEVDASGRYETINPGGDAAVPKVGMRWQPVDEQVTLRGTYSEGFIAPSIYSVYGPTGGNTPNALVQGELGQVNVTQPNNPNLEPSHSKQFTAGIIYRPKQIQGLTLSAEYYHIEQDNVAARPSSSAVYANLNQYGAGPGSVQNQVHYTGPLSGSAQNQITIDDAQTYSITLPLLNGGQQKTDGIDFGINYVKPTESAGTFTLSGNANLLTGYYFRSPALAGTDSSWWRVSGQYTDASTVAGANGTVPDFFVTAGLGWEYHNFFASVTGRYIPVVWDLGTVYPGYAGQSISPNLLTTGLPGDGRYKIPDYYSIDLQVAYIFKSDSGSKWYDNTRLAVGVNNLTDTSAPFIPSAFEDNTDKSTYDIVGRFVYFQVSKKF